MPAFSYSRLEAFQTCKLKYKYAYIDRVKVKREDTVEAYLGSCAHEALEKLYQDIRYEKVMTLEELLSCFSSIWEQGWKESIVIVKKEYTAGHYRKMGERYLKDYYVRHAPFLEGRILGLETQNYLSLDEDGTYKYHVRIDRLMDIGNGVYEVHDYKTNMRLPPQQDLNQDKQLAMYSLWVREQFKDFKEVRLVWHFLAFDKEMDSFRTEEQLEELRHEILRTIHEIERTEDFSPTVSRLCDWCLFQDICPEWKHKKAVEQLPENEFLKDPGIKLVDEYIRIKEELDANRKEADEKLARIKEALIAFSQKKDMTTVVGSEKKISIKEYEYNKLPGKNSKERLELIEILKETGKWDEVSDLDIYSLGKIIQTQEWEETVLKQLRKYVVLETSYRLNVSNK